MRTTTLGLITLTTVIMFATLAHAGDAQPRSSRQSAANRPLPMPVLPTADPNESQRAPRGGSQVATVTSTADSGSGSLRDAIVWLNSNDPSSGVPHVINFDLPGDNPWTITLTTGELVVSESTVINGPGADQLTISGNDASRVFLIGGGRGGVNYEIKNLTIADGNAIGGFGGGIFTNDNRINSVLIHRCTIRDCAADFSGGGLYLANAGTYTITDSAIIGNVSGSGSGGVYVGDAPLVITNSTISGNSGSGLEFFAMNDPAPITASLKNVTITNSTGTAVLVGVEILGTAATLESENSIFANSPSVNLFASGSGAAITSLGHNILDDASGDPTPDPTDLLNTDPLLMPLSNYGGPTPTVPPMGGSPAIDNGSELDGASAPGLIGTDQRGVARPVDGDNDGTATPDIGAVEYDGPHAAFASVQFPAICEDQTFSFPFLDPPFFEDPDNTFAQLTLTTVLDDPTLITSVTFPSANEITVVPAPDANGQTPSTVIATDPNGLAAELPISFTVNAVNDVPSFDITASHVSNEDDGPISEPDFATNISPGPANESGQVLTFNIANVDNPGLFSTPPAIDAAGTLTYEAVPNANGVAIIDVELMDDGALADITNCDPFGDDTSDSQTFSITVNGVNDPPMNNVPPTQTTLEDTNLVFSADNGNAITISDVDAGNASIGTEITAINGKVWIPGQGFFPGAIIGGTVAQINDVLEGFTFRPDPDFNGLAMLQIDTDDFGNSTNRPGRATDSDVIDINVTPVNDPPRINDAVAQVDSNEDEGPVTRAVVLDASPGPPDESGQALSFNVLTNSNSGLFSVQPTIDAAGMIHYESALNAFGSARVTYEPMDNGGTANGGIDTGGQMSVDIVVNPVNDPPTAVCVPPFEIDMTSQCILLALEDIDGGSFDVDDFSGALTFNLDPEGILSPGPNTITLTVTDPDGDSNSCTTIVTVVGDDCNGNTFPDACDLAHGEAEDCNNNGIPDECDIAPEFPTDGVALPALACVDARYICPGIPQNGATFPLAPGVNQSLFCGVFFGANDVFYRYRPAYSGQAYVVVQGPPLDWLTAVHSGCPATSANQVACNQFGSGVLFDAVAGQEYIIRLAAAGFATGSYTFTLTGPDCLPSILDINANGVPDACDCLADVNGDNVVDMTDYMAVLMAQGACGSCPEDIDRSGVVDSTDLQIVLSSLGPCPFAPPPCADGIPGPDSGAPVVESLRPASAAALPSRRP